MDRKTIENDIYFGTLKVLIDEGKSVTMTPKGNSMLPFIRGDHDSVVVAPVRRRLEAGDIILGLIGSRYVMHRIIEVEGDRITMRGDGNYKGTESLTADQVIGIVTEIIKEGSGKRVKPGKARLWRFLRPFRRYILFFYKRIFLQ